MIFLSAFCCLLVLGWAYVMSPDPELVRLTAVRDRAVHLVMASEAAGECMEGATQLIQAQGALERYGLQ